MKDCRLLYLYSRHPLAIQIMREILPDACSPVKSVPRTSLPGQGSTGILVVDVCSVAEWREAVSEWTQTRQGRSMILVPSEWDSERQLQALYLGVAGIIPFSPNLRSDMLGALTAVSNGLLWVTRAALTHYVEKTCPSRTKSMCNFTLREEQTIDLISKGLPNRTIAEILRISERTVKFHVANILQKQNVRNRRELVQKLTRVQLSAKMTA